MKIDKVNNVVVLTIGTDDLSNPQGAAKTLEDLIQSEGQRNFIADLSKLDQISSLQVGAIVTLHLICYENLAVMKLANVSTPILKVLKLVGLDKLMELHHGVEVARQSFGGK